MKTYLTLSVSLVGLFASAVAVCAADESAALVKTSRSLQVACVRSSSENAPWYIMQEAFVRSMSVCLAGRDANVMPIKIDVSNEDRASEALENAECDAVLVMGETLPAALRNKQFSSVRAVSVIGAPVRVFHFVTRNSDPAMQAVLSAAFEKATASASFQDTVGRASAVRVVAVR